MVTFNELGNLGRFGNQMFQIAAAVALASRNGTEAQFKKWDYESFFQHPPIINPGVRSYGEFREEGFNYKPILYSPGISLFGYFQTEKYFFDQQDKIRNTFKFNPNGLSPEHEAMAQTSCSIHVRRTDYLQPDKQAYHPFPGIDYYLNAIKYMNETHGITTFLVFSDDMKWCKDNFSQYSGQYNFVYITGYRDVKDMYLMSQCQHHIIANSSFSWWGAWLNPSKTKTVIAPKQWFGPAFKQDYSDIYCEGWIKM